MPRFTTTVSSRTLATTLLVSLGVAASLASLVLIARAVSAHRNKDTADTHDHKRRRSVHASNKSVPESLNVADMFDGKLSDEDLRFICETFNFLDEPPANEEERNEAITRANNLCAALPLNDDDKETLVRALRAKDDETRFTAHCLVSGLIENYDHALSLANDLLNHIVRHLAAEQHLPTHILLADMVSVYVRQDSTMAAVMAGFTGVMRHLLSCAIDTTSTSAALMNRSRNGLIRTIVNLPSSSALLDNKFLFRLGQPLAKELKSDKPHPTATPNAAYLLQLICQRANDDDWLMHLDDWMQTVNLSKLVLALLHEKRFTDPDHVESFVNCAYAIITVIFNQSSDAIEPLVKNGEEFLAAFFDNFRPQYFDTARPALACMIYESDELADLLVEKGYIEKCFPSHESIPDSMIKLTMLHTLMTLQPKDATIAEFERLDLFAFAAARLADRPAASSFLRTFCPNPSILHDALITALANRADAPIDLDPHSSDSSSYDPAAELALFIVADDHLEAHQADPEKFADMAVDLVDNGKLLHVIRRLLRVCGPSVRERREIARVLCTLSRAMPDRVDDLVALHHEPLLAQIHSLLAEVLPMAAQIVQANRRGQRLDDLLAVATARLERVEVLWFAVAHHLHPAQVAQLWEGGDEAARMTVAEILDLCGALLKLYVTDSQGRAFPLVRLADPLDTYVQKHGLAYSDLADEFRADLGMGERSQFILDVLYAPFVILSALVSYDNLRDRVLEYLPLLAFNSSRFAYEALGRDATTVLFKAPWSDAKQYHELAMMRYPTCMGGSSSDVRAHRIINREMVSRIIVRTRTRDTVHWARASGAAETGVRGNLVLNMTHMLNSAISSHGVTQRGKYAFTVTTTHEQDVFIGWATRDAMLASGTQFGWDKEAYAVSFHAGVAMHDAKTRVTNEYLMGMGTLHCMIDLDEGTVLACIAGKQPHVVFRGVDTSKVWFPCVTVQPNHSIETDFSAKGVWKQYVPLAVAVATPKGTYPVEPLDADVAAVVPHKRVDVGALEIPPKEDEVVSALPCFPKFYFEVDLVPNELVAVGFQDSGRACLWVAAPGLEMVVVFPCADIESSTEWNSAIPSLVALLSVGQDIQVPQAIAVTVSDGENGGRNVKVALAGEPEDGMLVLYSYERFGKEAKGVKEDDAESWADVEETGDGDAEKVKEEGEKEDEGEEETSKDGDAAKETDAPVDDAPADGHAAANAAAPANGEAAANAALPTNGDVAADADAPAEPAAPTVAATATSSDTLPAPLRRARIGCGIGHTHDPTHLLDPDSDDPSETNLESAETVLCIVKHGQLRAKDRIVVAKSFSAGTQDGAGMLHPVVLGGSMPTVHLHVGGDMTCALVKDRRVFAVQAEQWGLNLEHV
ncbi:hypothetical protein AMAG_08117 [Allomyces macrogynus ATCC 38327]|uniref:SPRY domain-containing protein n=1 Tax=Allomyces macrogynus (strain ATCC 38327) TaxID=578462 RepID=A0A0L0SKF7_ALLM3|nr:hypothetical protein AMAG_08117 [Allomyces macrogynus ATCC 38327]|eukprot:KNE62943.1 hypothetical protein AMAG_08117 [Allomyces macrogynus ATCC 38327]